MLNVVISHPRENLQKIMDAPDTPYFIEWSIKLAMQGDLSTWTVFVERLVGKVKDEIDVNVKPTIIKRRDGTEVVLGMEKKEE